MEKQHIIYVINIPYGETRRNICFRGDGENFVSEEGITIKLQRDSENDVVSIAEVKCPEAYRDEKEIIAEAFAARWDEVQEKRKENYESGFEANADTEGAEGDDQDAMGVIFQPYDPNSITVSPGKYSLREIVGMIDGDEDDESTLDLSPDFQREYVWDSTRQSRLIESILLNIPLPVFYFAKNKDGKLQVVDGVQRLTTIHRYFHNKFSLSRLEYLGEECNGKYFKVEKAEKSLHPKLFRALRKYQIDCNIIEPSTPEAVKLDIFRRLNTGGKALNRQEIRHSFMKKDVRDFLKELASSEQFLMATGKSIKDTRMMAQELVLRYIGFYSLYIENFLQIVYQSKMDEYLDDIAVKLNECKKIPYDQIRDVFCESMEKAIIMFGDYAFRKVEFDEEGEISRTKYPINKSLFITFAVLLPKFSMEKIRAGGSVLGNFAGFLREDKDFFYMISHNTNYQLKDALEKVEGFLKEIYEKERICNKSYT